MSPLFTIRGDGNFSHGTCVQAHQRLLCRRLQVQFTWFVNFLKTAKTAPPPPPPQRSIIGIIIICNLDQESSPSHRSSITPLIHHTAHPSMESEFWINSIFMLNQNFSIRKFHFFQKTLWTLWRNQIIMFSQLSEKKCVLGLYCTYLANKRPFGYWIVNLLLEYTDSVMKVSGTRVRDHTFNFPSQTHFHNNYFADSQLIVMVCLCFALKGIIQFWCLIQNNQ